MLPVQKHDACVGKCVPTGATVMALHPCTIHSVGQRLRKETTENIGSEIKLIHMIYIQAFHCAQLLTLFFEIYL